MDLKYIHFGVIMTVNLSIKDVPVATAARLRERAARNHRSLQGELMAILETVAAEATEQGMGRKAIDAGQGDDTACEQRLSIDEAARRARVLFPTGTPSSTDFIRAARDGRYGEDWAGTGRHLQPD